MSKVVLKTEKQLRTFLQILAEESVARAQTDLNGRMQQQKVAADIQRSKSAFNEEDPPAEPAAEPPPPPKAPEKQQAAKPQPAAAQGKQEISPKFDSLVDAINSLRGAPSTKDNTVETQLRAYYDKLNAAEAAAAILFVRTVADVMQGNVEGSSAPDPRDYEITTTMKKADEPQGQSTPPASAPEPTSPESGPEPEEEEPDSEDTAPPIKVGGEQVSEAYRNKIRDLLRGR